ncbi:MAG: hypothetical protein VYC34_10075 [Planctomycetota bacterium]|nr:hypothetical protein [Planctomycetota bacterium]
MTLQTSHYQPGKRVRVTQQIVKNSREPVTITIEGVIEGYEQSKTGSWFAHSKDDKLWLERLVLRRDDGEEVVCNLDQYTHVEAI